ncbi:MAG TPA: alginate lyase family protein [Pirellulales bacterium]|nr:alginate lyase family protein [Pirellulales bacterium]
MSFAYAENPPAAQPTSTMGAKKSAEGFFHPGVLVNLQQLEFIKAKVAAQAEPWKSAFEAAKASELGSLQYMPHAWKTCECGSYSRPDLGCKDEQHDSEAAYTQALLWFISGNETYARNAIAIMNAWSGNLHGGHTNSNGPIQAAWCAEQWPRAAEIIRYTSGGWSADDVAQFQDMLVKQYLPSIVNGSGENGNKELAMSEALINIGVFNDDRATFDAGIKMWRGRAPAYIYLTTDGPTPLKAANHDEMPIWGNKGKTTPLVDGLLQESVRDSQHANLGLAAMVNAAETARQQGIDLYKEQGKRIMAALEYQAQFLPPNHAPTPENLSFHEHPTWKIAYNHFHNRMGFELPKIAAVIAKNRPTGVNHLMAWETLTHTDVGAVGLPPVEKQ